jgi:PAS domain-containing protein
MSQGLVLFDSDRRVVICNKRYMEIYGLTPDQVKPGTPVRDLIEHRLSLGLKTGSPNGEYVRQRIEGPVVPANAFHEFADGRTIAYAIRSMLMAVARDLRGRDRQHVLRPHPPWRIMTL